MPKDACYSKVKAQYAVFPSARASQAIAKCRKGKGTVRKTKAGTNLKRWQAEKWQDTKSGKLVVPVVQMNTAGLQKKYLRILLKQQNQVNNNILMY